MVRERRERGGEGKREEGGREEGGREEGGREEGGREDSCNNKPLSPSLVASSTTHHGQGLGS